MPHLAMCRETGECPNRSSVKRTNRSRSAFSLVELLVVIAIVAILIALLLPAVQSAREAARRTKCVNSLKQLGVAVQSYHNAHRMLPLGDNPLPPGPAPGWNTNFSAHVRLLPYLEEQSLYDRFDLDTYIYMPQNVPLLGTSIELFHCPSERAAKTSQYNGFPPDPIIIAHTNYVGSAGSRWYHFCQNQPSPVRQHYNGVFLPRNTEVRFQDVTDGCSKTLLFGERARDPIPDPDNNGWWTSGHGADTLFVTFHAINKVHSLPPLVGSPSEIMVLYGGASSYHPGGANFCFADGSVRFLSEDIDSWDLTSAAVLAMCNVDAPLPPEQLLQALSTRNGNEVVNGF
jgi:prepilin-type processing-associated H-X9-DG protein/prepilin-type N-terminal cleavage/methylation domain-containing protein